MRVLVDVDGVLGDFASEVVQFLDDQCEYLCTLEHFTTFELLESVHCERYQDRLDAHMAATRFARHMPVYPGARSFVAALRVLGEVVVVTSPYSAIPTWTYDRIEWLWEHFAIPKCDVIFAKRKELVRGDFLIDDRIENCRAFEAEGGRALLFDRPWNRSDTTLTRVHSYGEALLRIDAVRP